MVGTKVVKWDAEMAKMAAEYNNTEASASSSNFISFKAGQMTLHDSPLEGNRLDCIVLDSVIENSFFSSEYDPDNPVPPSCYAFGRDVKDMKPHSEVTKKECESLCAECWANMFGSAEKGRGKACKNIRRIAVLPISGNKLSVDVIARSEIVMSKIPITSVPAWAAHVKSIAEVLKKPPLGVVTQIGCVPDAKTQFKVTFKVMNELKDQALFGALIKRREEAAKMLISPYPKPEEVKPAAKKKAAASKQKYKR
jgi:hypothetical protein